jgi:hypothetical protein
VALLFAAVLVSAALEWDFSPFSYITPNGHALLAWLLALGMVVLAGLIWLVLRHDTDALWLASPAGDGTSWYQRGSRAAGFVGRARPSTWCVPRWVLKRSAALRSRVTVWARPLARRAVVKPWTRPSPGDGSGDGAERLPLRVKVLKSRSWRYLP